MQIQLSEHFTFKKLLRFVLPSITMMIFTSIYGVVDGLFVSNYAGKTPFAAVNLIMPFPMLLGALGFMVGTGGSAIVSKTLGEGKKELANRYFSMLVYFAIAASLLLTILGILCIPKIAKMLGADKEMLHYCVIYGTILLLALPAFVLQNVFQSFLVTAEKPDLGLKITVIAGITNMALDYLFIAVFHWGIAGAAVATALSQIVGGIIPLCYFARPNNSLLQLIKTPVERKILLKACANGSSELLTNVSMSLVNILYNFQLMKFAGENGVAAYGVIMYVSFIFLAIYIGYSIGSAPIIGYNYGSGNHSELKNMFRKSLFLMSITGIILTLSALILASPLARIFVGYDNTLMELTRIGFQLYSLNFLITGFNIFSSAFFTALNNGIISAAISFLRTCVFQLIVLVTLPVYLGINGIWLSIVVAELLALMVSITFLIRKRKYYHYA